MQRREFIGLVGGAAVWPLSTRAQTKDLVIGFLSTRSPEEAASHTAGFVRGLNEAGYIDGQNVRIEYRWARGQYGRLAALAAELVTVGPSVLSAGGAIPPR